MALELGLSEVVQKMLEASVPVLRKRWVEWLVAAARSVTAPTIELSWHRTGILRAMNIPLPEGVTVAADMYVDVDQETDAIIDDSDDEELDDESIDESAIPERLLETIEPTRPAQLEERTTLTVIDWVLMKKRGRPDKEAENDEIKSELQGSRKRREAKSSTVLSRFSKEAPGIA